MELVHLGPFVVRKGTNWQFALIAGLIFLNLVQFWFRDGVLDSRLQEFVDAIVPNFVASVITFLVAITYVTRPIEQGLVHQGEVETAVENIKRDMINSLLKPEHLNTAIAEIKTALHSPRIADLKQVHDRFPLGRLESEAKSAKNIKIHLTWIIEIESLITVINAGVANHASIKILHLDPDISTFEQRCLSLGYDVSQERKKVKENIEKLINSYSSNKDIHVELRFYHGTPSMRSFIFDDRKAFAGFWPTRALSTHTPHLEMEASASRSGVLFQMVSNDFDKRWNELTTRKLNFQTGNLELLHK